MDAITLDQFAVFLAITEEGSFAAAARKLGRAQSAVTYAVQKLEDQSGVLLFDRSTYRPALTEAGRALLPRIRRIMDDFGEYRVQAQGMARGVEAELVLAIDNFLPLSLITSALEAFRHTYPMVQLRLNAQWGQDAAQDVIDAGADLGILIGNTGLPPELEYRHLAGVDLVAVAAPGHPLASLPPGLPREAMRDHLQIVISNPKTTHEARTYGVIGVNQWRVSEARLRHNLVMSGLGWGSMPRPMVEAEIKRGELVVLEPAQWGASDRMPRLDAVVARRRDRALGPAGRFLMDQMAAEGGRGSGLTNG